MAVSSLHDIANLHFADIDAFYASFFENQAPSCQSVVLKVTSADMAFLQARLEQFPGFDLSSLKTIRGMEYVQVGLKQACDKNMLRVFLEAQDYILGALLVPDGSMAFAPDQLVLHVLNSRVGACAQACRQFAAEEALQLEPKGDDHRGLNKICLKFNRSVSLPELFKQLEVMEKNPCFGIVRFFFQDFTPGCSKVNLYPAIADYKKKHGIT